jgi:hypothetical protein
MMNSLKKTISLLLQSTDSIIMMIEFFTPGGAGRVHPIPFRTADSL